MADADITSEELDELVERTKEATSAFMQGDMDRYLALTRHARGFTLANPFGGVPTRDDDRAPSLKAVASSFSEGEAKLELVEAHAWDDTVVMKVVRPRRGARPLRSLRRGDRESKAVGPAAWEAGSLVLPAGAVTRRVAPYSGSRGGAM